MNNAASPLPVELKCACGKFFTAAKIPLFFYYIADLIDFRFSNTQLFTDIKCKVFVNVWVSRHSCFFPVFRVAKHRVITPFPIQYTILFVQVFY